MIIVPIFSVTELFYIQTKFAPFSSLNKDSKASAIEEFFLLFLIPSYKHHSPQDTGRSEKNNSTVSEGILAHVWDLTRESLARDLTREGFTREVSSRLTCESPNKLLFKRM